MKQLRPLAPATTGSMERLPNSAELLRGRREGEGGPSQRLCAIIPSASPDGPPQFLVKQPTRTACLPFRQRRAMPRMAPTRAPTTSTMWQQHAALSLSRRQASSPAGARHARRACVGPSTKAKPQGADRPASAAAGANQHRTLHTARPSDCAPPPSGLEHARPCSQAASGLLG